MRLLALLITLGGGFWLKLVYSRAGADELAWVLTPSAFIAQLAGVELVPEPGAGFISRSAHMVVGPACAGVNFLLASWLALYSCMQGGLRQPRLRGLLALSVLCLSAAYLVTVSMNGLRIALAAQLFALDIYSSLWTKARVHRLLGVVLYAAALCALCLAAERLRTLAPSPDHIVPGHDPLVMQIYPPAKPELAHSIQTTPAPPPVSAIAYISRHRRSDASRSAHRHPWQSRYRDFRRRIR